MNSYITQNSTISILNQAFSRVYSENNAKELLMSAFDIETSTIAHYQIERLLARGGMSIVYLARDTHLDRQVAIKLVHKSEHDYYERFQYEAKTLASLENEHILPVFDYGEFGSWFYMTMPYVEYGSLRDRLAKGILSIQEVEKILTQLVDAVQYAHDRGIVHRDIKPSNILLRHGEHVYLADFGLVKHLEEMSDLTQAGCVLGTPEYMAPELTEQPATPGSDIYALGIVLYYMLTGRVPFKSSTPIGVCWKHFHEQPIAPSMYNHALSPAIDRVILGALAKRPEQRIQSANDLLQAYQASINEDEATVKVVKVSAIATIPSTVTRRPRVKFHRNRTFPHHIFNKILKMRVGALLIIVALLLFIAPALLSFAFSHGHGNLQVPMTLRGNSPLSHNHIVTKTPAIHPTLVVSRTPAIRPTLVVNKTSTQHSATLPLKSPSAPSSNESGNNSQGNNNSDRGSGKNKKHKHEHDKDD